MSGPIVRTGTTPKFWQNWDQVFGNKKGTKSNSGEAKSSAKSAKSAKKASSKSPSTKSVVGKKAKKPAGKKK